MGTTTWSISLFSRLISASFLRITSTSSATVLSVDNCDRDPEYQDSHMGVNTANPECQGELTGQGIDGWQWPAMFLQFLRQEVLIP